MTIASVTDLIRQHEGCELKPYKDTQGKVSIGWGRCLDTKGISQDEADAMLADDVGDAINQARAVIGDLVWSDIGDVRRAAIVDMAFELGQAGLSKFERMIAAAQIGEWQSAAAEALASTWATQVPSRAKIDAQMILSGEWPA